MIYLKRFLYLLSVIIVYILALSITFLYIVIAPIGLIISFLITEDCTKYFDPLQNVDCYIVNILYKLKDIFLDN